MRVACAPGALSSVTASLRRVTASNLAVLVSTSYSACGAAAKVTS